MYSQTKQSRKYVKLLIWAGVALSIFLFGFWNTRQLDAKSISYVGAVAVDAQANLYVVNNGCVRKFDAQGALVGDWGPWQCSNEYNKSQSILNLAIDHAGNFYALVNTGQNNQIQKLDNSGKVLLTLPGQLGNYYQKAQIAFDGANNVYITDYTNLQVSKFDSQGHLLAQIGSKGSGEGQFRTTFNIAVDSQGDLYASDDSERDSNAAPRIQKFDSQGKYIGLIGQANIVAEMNNNAVQRNEISALGLMTVDSEGNLNVVAGFWKSFSYDFYLVKFSPTGEYLGKFGSYGSFKPVSLATGPDKGIVYKAFTEAPRGPDTVVQLNTSTNQEQTLISTSWENYFIPVIIMGVAALLGGCLLLIGLIFALVGLSRKNKPKPQTFDPNRMNGYLP